MDVSGLFTITMSGLKLFTMIYRGIVPPFKDMPERSAYIDIFLELADLAVFVNKSISENYQHIG